MCSGVNTLFWNPQEFGRISFNTSSTQCTLRKMTSYLLQMLHAIREG